ncbi:MAG: ABC transporter ATP-binding protein [Paludibacter sp.]
MPTAIKFENISKQYRLGLVSTQTLSHDLNRWFQTSIRGKEDPYLKIGDVNDRASKADSDYVWALRDIDFEVQQGDVLGIIGKNGAGKSTLLKILSKVTAPTTGSIKASGRIASLLEVGTGFHPEMTGRENIFMNGAIMGMTKAEINRKLDEIVDFSGVERYIDTPAKRYSSGMTVRLGFAIAAHLDPEILVVDEVLAVGDAEFQKKAIGKMQDVSKGEGRTVLFVSHNMAAVRTLCNKGLLLENGTTKLSGDISEVIENYLSEDNKLKSIWERSDALRNDASFISIKLIDKDENAVEILETNAEYFIEIKYQIYTNTFYGTFAFEIVNGSDISIFTSHDHDVSNIDYATGNYISKIKLPNSLRPGSYYINIGSNTFGFDSIEYYERVISFEVVDSNHKQSSKRPGIINCELTWEILKEK